MSEIKKKQTSVKHKSGVNVPIRLEGSPKVAYWMALKTVLPFKRGTSAFKTI